VKKARKLNVRGKEKRSIKYLSLKRRLVFAPVTLII